MMLATLPCLDFQIYTNSAVLAALQVPPAAVHWTLPPDNPAYQITSVEFTNVERKLTAEEQRLMWAALIASSELVYEF